MGNLSPYHPTSLSKLQSWASQPLSHCIAEFMLYLLRFGATKNETDDEFDPSNEVNIEKYLRATLVGLILQKILSKLFLSPRKYSTVDLLIANF